MKYPVIRLAGLLAIGTVPWPGPVPAPGTSNVVIVGFCATAGSAIASRNRATFCIAKLFHRSSPSLKSVDVQIGEDDLPPATWLRENPDKNGSDPTGQCRHSMPGDSEQHVPFPPEGLLALNQLGVRWSASESLRSNRESSKSNLTSFV
jgi:hypothetical protein